MKPAKTVDGARKRLIAAVHAEAKRHGMDTETRRGLIKLATGKASSAELTVGELGKVLDAIKGRSRRAAGEGRVLADTPHARKIRALWLSLYHLGLVADPTEAALAHFAERQCKVMALQWVSVEESVKIIEALKAWAVRDAGVCWDAYQNILGQKVGENAAARVLEAQQAIMQSLGLAFDPVDARYMPLAEVNSLIAAHGAQIREAKSHG